MQAGLLEFKAGSAERGRSIFEGVLRNYPKRLDLWSVYLDQASTPDVLFSQALERQQRTIVLFLSVANPPHVLKPASVCIQEVKLGDRRRVEALFERAAAMDLPPKKMKVLMSHKRSALHLLSLSTKVHVSQLLSGGQSQKHADSVLLRAVWKLSA